MMKGTLLAGAAIVALAFTSHSSAFDRRSGDDRPAQNIERDVRAQTRARLRDALGGFGPVFSRGREVRSFDGSGNNQNDPLAGASFQPMRRIGGVHYADGIGGMAGPLRKSARAISNHVSAQSVSLPNTYGTSDFLWQWGQFIDHDLDLGDAIASDDRSFDIPVPSGDPYFDPAGLGDKTIRFDRAIIAAGSGADLSNPRKPMNEISSWIDGSMVYGSDPERADALRTHDGTGRLRTSRGDLLPLNTGLLPNANGPAPDPSKLFLAGDVRANEQLGLAVMHTLFVREHNRWAMRIRQGRPYYSGDDIYHAARRMVIAQIQIITYEEFLPALIGEEAISPYVGYTPGDATISVEFAGAAYRLGHTLINKDLLRLDRRGRIVRDGHVALRDAFFNAPQFLKRRNDLDPILRGLAAQKSQRYDPMIVDDLRNFLFGPPGAGGFDLASLNIQRGRDLGLPSYNDMREAMGLGRVSDFDEITSDPARQEALYKAYGSVDDIDLWIGGLSEDPVSSTGSQLGPLFRKIVAEEFKALRDHDRFWHERDLSAAELQLVKGTRLSDIIHANTNVRRGEIPGNVFYAQR